MLKVIDKIIICQKQRNTFALFFFYQNKTICSIFYVANITLPCILMNTEENPVFFGITVPEKLNLWQNYVKFSNKICFLYVRLQQNTPYQSLLMYVSQYMLSKSRQTEYGF